MRNDSSVSARIADPLFPHLLDVLADPASEGLILAGGFGLRLKQEHLRRTGARTLLAEIPPARATQDLDFFLRMELWSDADKGAAVRGLLDRLGYRERVPHLKFEKALAPDARTVKVDLLARTPLPEENIPVRRAADPTRHPSRVGSGTGIDLHGGETPEAFAVEDAPVSVAVSGVATDGTPVEASVLVPHPYAWLNMKVKAADDWTQRPKPFAEKHAFDVYLLVAMLTPDEVAKAETLAARYANHSVAAEVRVAAARLYGEPSGPGFAEAERQASGPLDHGLFWEALRAALGIAPS
ncbi:MAG: hypothetical protein SFU56_19365 [Capsulimonadales bacterium]|nr:hypothetical protein [Capsulimonadales bacterium]